MPSFAEKHNQKRKEVEQEIEEHGKTWCQPDCTKFWEREYRRLRLVSGLSVEEVQGDYPSCHTPEIKPP